MKKVLYVVLVLIVVSVFTLYAQQTQGARQGEPIRQGEVLSQDKPTLNEKQDDDVSSMDPVYSLIGIPTEINQKCVTFFNTLINGQVEKAYNEFLKDSPILRNKDKVKEQVIKTTQAIELYGKISASEQAGAEYTSISYVKVKFLSIHPFNPILWTFTFYNSPIVGWIVLNLKYTDVF